MHAGRSLDKRRFVTDVPIGSPGARRSRRETGCEVGVLSTRGTDILMCACSDDSLMCVVYSYLNVSVALKNLEHFPFLIYFNFLILFLFFTVCIAPRNGFYLDSWRYTNKLIIIIISN